jgi:hypothetical protein
MPRQYIYGIRPEIFEWQRFDAGVATDLAIGVNGDLWIVGVQAHPGGREILSWTGRTWHKHDVGGVAIAVGPRGEPWVLAEEGLVRHRPRGGEWIEAPRAGGAAIDVSAGADGSVWAVVESGGDGDEPAGRAVVRWSGDGWTADWDEPSPVTYPGFARWTVSDAPQAGLTPSTARRLADGLPWVLDDNGAIYRRVPGGWQLQPEEPATEIAIGPDGNVWILGPDQRPGGLGVYRFYHGTDWDSRPDRSRAAPDQDGRQCIAA